ncbi:histidine kinase [Glutamicibacter mishrai]|uniref:histidine kinase n=1 Tax=Glutamicibacter mishrai TaxID=1775880 RepID=A0A6H0SLY2_9MICC|nr:histidine kinase [Glutamicibacter mishrai]QIV87429.1 two-component sensor histidine kinase [Glutamicibacter mishrai]UTT40102.1 histidine kinase [Glutamicibacter mishrai]
MSERLKDTLTKHLAGRGVIVWVGIAVLMLLSGSEFLTLFRDGFSRASQVTILGALVGPVLCIVLAVGLRWVAVSLGLFVAVAFFFLNDGFMFFLTITAFMIFGSLAGTASARSVRALFLTLSTAWMVQFGIQAQGDAVLLVALAPLSALSYLVTRSIYSLREKNANAVEQMQRAQEQTRTAIDKERKNIARDLHDIVAHDITIVAMQSKAAKFANDGQMALEALDVISKLSSETLHDLRLMLNVLRADGTMSDEAAPGIDAPAATTVYALQGAELFAQRLKDANFQVTSTMDARISDLPRSAQTAIYRVMQEGTTNVIKHGAPGSSCTLELLSNGTEAVLEITNQIDVSEKKMKGLPEGGSGLIGMSDRMRTFGGKFSTSSKNGFWTLRASIPF